MSDKQLLINLKQYFTRCREEQLEFCEKAKSQLTKRHFTHVAAVYQALGEQISEDGTSLVVK